MLPASTIAMRRNETPAQKAVRRFNLRIRRRGHLALVSIMDVAAPGGGYTLDCLFGPLHKLSTRVFQVNAAGEFREGV